MTTNYGQWPKEKIWAWYNARPWIRGCNFMSSDCSNRIDQWQEFVRQQTRDIEDPKEKLVTTWRSAVGYIIGNEEMMALLKNDPTIFPMFPNVDPIEEYNDWSVQYVKEILEEGIEKGAFRATINVDIAATMLFGWYKYLIVSSVEMEELDETLIEETMSTLGIILFDGLLIVPEEGV